MHAEGGRLEILKKTSAEKHPTGGLSALIILYHALKYSTRG